MMILQHYPSSMMQKVKIDDQKSNNNNGTTDNKRKCSSNIITNITTSRYYCNISLFLLLVLLSLSSTAAALAATTYRFRHKTVIIPHDDKKDRGGEDAAATSSDFLIVADGVGGWARHGVNPGLFSKLLVDTILKFGQELQDEEEQEKDLSSSSFLTDVVDRANHYTATKHLGSATCTTLQLVVDEKEQPLLRTLNVGDSGYSIHRYNATTEALDVVFVSEVGQKRFNYPHQLGGPDNGDAVKDVAISTTHTDIIPSTDIIVVYSDGVSDNLYPHQFNDDCLKFKFDKENNKVELLSHSWSADCIARKSYFLGKDKNFDSPFAQGGRESGFYPNYKGGKHDDITVVVAQITDEDEKDDPYYKDSITLYTGPVDDTMPTLNAIMHRRTEEL